MKKDIVTKKIERFLKHEFKFYPSMTDYKVFVSAMVEIICSCKVCGTIYWQGCKPRCQCNNDNGILNQTLFNRIKTYLKIKYKNHAKAMQF